MRKKLFRRCISWILITSLMWSSASASLVNNENFSSSTQSFLNNHSNVSVEEGKIFETVFEDYITVEGNKLMDGSDELKFVSLNYPQALTDTPWEQNNAIKTIKTMGGNVTRTYTIPVYNGSNESTAYVTGVDSDGQVTFNEDALIELDHLLDAANRHGVRLIIPLVDHWHWIGGMDGYVAMAGVEINTTSSLDPNAWQFYTNADARAYFKQMITHLMDRTNTITGVKYKDDPAILCWETGNELAAYDDVNNPVFNQEWTTDIAAHIKSTGINQLILDGKMDATSESLKDDNIDILGSHYYTGSFPEKLRKDMDIANNTIANPIKNDEDDVLSGKPFILGEFGGYTDSSQADQVFDVGLELDTSGMMMWSLRAHKDGYGYYFHPENPGNWAAYHWPGFPSGDYYDETDMVRSIYSYAQVVNGNAASIAEAKAMPIPAPELDEAPLLYTITTVGDIQWRGVVGGAWYEIQRANGTNPSEQDFETIADFDEYVYDSGRNWEDKSIACIAGYHDETAITGQEYTYRLRAKNTSGEGLWSNEVSTTAVHKVVDNMDLIAVTSNDQNPTEIRNVYSHDHSSNVVASGGVLQNASLTEGYVSYGAIIPLDNLKIATKNTPDILPKVFISKDDITYTEVSVEGQGSDYYVNDLPEKTYFIRVYLGGENQTLVDKVELEYIYSGDVNELRGTTNNVVKDLIQDEDFTEDYTIKSENLVVVSDSGLTTNDDSTAELIYTGTSDMTSYRVSAFVKEGHELVVETSMDGITYETTGVTSIETTNNGYVSVSVSNLDMTTSARFLRISYPAEQNALIVESVEVAFGQKRIPMQTLEPINVLEDGEYYFGKSTYLESAYVVESSSIHKVLTNKVFSGYDVFYMWIKGDSSNNNLTISLVDKNDVVWHTNTTLSSSEGRMEKFEFRDFTSNQSDTAMDLSEVKSMSINIDTAENLTLALNEDHAFTGNYGIALEYDYDGNESKIYFDNAYVGSLTKVDDYEEYNGSNTLLQNAYSRNTGGGSLIMTLSDRNIEGAYGMSIAYDYAGKGYAGATKSMDYLNLNDYDGLKLWYEGDGSGNSLTIQVKTSDGLSWEAVGYMDAVGPTELYMPFDSFLAPSWDPREGSLDKSLNITEFSLYTNLVDDVTSGEIYFDDIKGANFIDDLKTATVDITSDDNMIATEYPFEVSGTAAYVNYITLNLGQKIVNVPVENGNWTYTVSEASPVYNIDDLTVTASIDYHNHNVDAIDSDTINLSVDITGNEKIEPIVYENMMVNGDFSDGFNYWDIEDFEVGDSNVYKLENGAFLTWSNDAYKGTITQTVNVPNGIYTMKANIKVKSGFNNARMKLISGDEEIVSTFLDTQDTYKIIEMNKTIEVKNGEITVSFVADAPSGGLVFSVDDVELNKIDDLTYIKNSDFKSLGVDWPNLPIDWDTSYEGGEGWSPIKGENESFVAYSGQPYKFELSQDVTLDPGVYKLSASMTLNDGENNSIIMQANIGDTELVSSNILDQLVVASATDVVLDHIEIEETSIVTLSVLGDFETKGVMIDDVILTYVKSLEEPGLLQNGDFNSLEADWPNLPVDWDTSYKGGEGWSPIKGENESFVAYSGQPYTFDLSQTVTLGSGVYSLSALMTLNDGVNNDVEMIATIGNDILVSKSVLEELIASTPTDVTLDQISISETSEITFTIRGDFESKGLSIDDVKLEYVKAYEAPALLTNGDFVLLETEWPNLPKEWITSYEGGEGWSPIKGENESFVAYSGQPYTFELSQEVQLDPGIYELSALMTLNDGVNNDVIMKATIEGQDIATISVLDQLTVSTSEKVVLEYIEVSETSDVTVSILGDFESKGLSIDDVELKYIGQYELPKLLKNGDFMLLKTDWPNLPLDWNTTYTGGEGWSPIKGENESFVAYSGQPYSFTLSQNAELEPGEYKLSASMTLNDGVNNDIVIGVYDGNKKIAKRSVLDELTASVATKVTLESIDVHDTTLITISILGDFESKGLSIDDIVLVRVGDVEANVDKDDEKEDKKEDTKDNKEETKEEKKDDKKAEVIEEKIVTTVSDDEIEKDGKGLVVKGDQAIRNGIENAQDKKDIRLVVPSDENADTVQVNISKDAFDELLNMEQLTVASELSEVTLSDKTLKAISKELDGEISIESAVVNTSELSKAIQNKVNGKPVFDFSIRSEDKYVSRFPEPVVISVPYTLEEGEDPSKIIVYFLDDQGELSVVSQSSYNTDTGMVTFSTKHFSMYGVGYNSVEFNDVKTDEWYFEAVDYIASRDITKGTGQGKFTPNRMITSAEYLVLMMKTFDIELTDTLTLDHASSGRYFDQYLATALSLGLLETGNGVEFNPDVEILREDMFAILYNIIIYANGSLEEVEELTVFEDFNELSWSKDAIGALIKADIVNGSDGFIQATRKGTRAETASLIYKILRK